MKQGQLVEQGQHQDLMVAGGQYESLFSQQQELESYRTNSLAIDEERGGNND